MTPAVGVTDEGSVAKLFLKLQRVLRLPTQGLGKVQFPFSARCIASKVVSPLRKGETVEVRGLARENSCAHDMLVLIRWRGCNVAVPLSQLTPVDADESTVEAIGDWHYWLAQGYCF